MYACAGSREEPKRKVNGWVEHDVEVITLDRRDIVSITRHPKVKIIVHASTDAKPEPMITRVFSIRRDETYRLDSWYMC